MWQAHLHTLPQHRRDFRCSIFTRRVRKDRGARTHDECVNRATSESRPRQAALARPLCVLLLAHALVRCRGYSAENSPGPKRWPPGFHFAQFVVRGAEGAKDQIFKAPSSRLCTSLVLNLRELHRRNLGNSRMLSAYK